VGSSVTADPPAVNDTVPPAVTAGAAWMAVSVLVPVALWLTPSLIDQSIVRDVWPPPPVGSPLAGLKL